MNHYIRTVEIESSTAGRIAGGIVNFQNSAGRLTESRAIVGKIWQVVSRVIGDGEADRRQAVPVMAW